MTREYKRRRDDAPGVYALETAGARTPVHTLRLEQGESAEFSTLHDRCVNPWVEDTEGHAGSFAGSWSGSGKTPDNYSDPWMLGCGPDERLGGNLGECKNAVRDSRPTDEMLRSYEAARRELEANLSEVELPTADVRRKRRRRDTGDSVNIDAVMCGDPDCWEAYTREAGQRVVRIFVSACYSGGTPTAEIVRGGVKAAALSDLLVSQGYRVEITSACGATMPGDPIPGRDWLGTKVPHYFVLETIKHSMQPLDIGAILCAGAPGHIRGMMYGALQSMPGAHSTAYPVQEPNSEIQDLLGLDIWIAGDDAYWPSRLDENPRLAAVFNAIKGLT